MSQPTTPFAVPERAATTPGFRRPGIMPQVLLLILAIVVIDGTAVEAWFLNNAWLAQLLQRHAWLPSAAHYNQWIANILMVTYFVWMYRRAPMRLKRLMKYGVVIATAGEVFFSLVVGMYEYRLENIPLYVPPGHSILYGAVYYFVREPWVQRNKRAVMGWMFGVSTGYVLYWAGWGIDKDGVPTHDLYGALCMLVFVVILARDASARLFFLTMFLVVAYLEQVGTRAGCWWWMNPAHLFVDLDWLPSGNPPSAISVFYFGFDGLCLLAYLVRNPELRGRLRRLKQRRRALAEKASATLTDKAG